jgi:hypothetical protein
MTTEGKIKKLSFIFSEHGKIWCTALGGLNLIFRTARAQMRVLTLILLGKVLEKISRPQSKIM